MSTCTSASRHLDEPLAGTAATARTWLLLEQPGPWGAKALTSSHLDPVVGRALEAAAEGTGVRVALIRRPGRHADRREVSERRVYVGHTVPGNVWLHSAMTSAPERLLDLDLAALGRGDHHTFGTVLRGRPHTGAPLALVCTNGKRDRCCALLGRPLAAELAASGVEGTWEVTHLGGHRFSPTLLVLPFGYVYGRAEAHHVKEVLHGVREGRVVTEGCRGGSAWERPGQAAELAVRTETGEDGADALAVLRTDGAAPLWDVTVAHTDGRRWTVTVAQGAAEPPRPESCGSTLGSPARMDVLTVRELSPATTAR
ncbi:sucrase ferredoxin [Streptomyces griseiscabiei]|uniref:Sucrase ferredoxin n=1 Tax=Streptomyces griseiscabiei TaxID=2993540 RepID=A0ABU4KXH6_9ACTN|nr:sucrase ferredoxin [Streptomyces griseiscabiei]MBZ3904267.1 sucrase ferredoxin [Streptomyces griseiscabiei]MDX2908013.1 sucrase ferredoxin [Streptomyces griseiscabiei]